MDHWLIFAIGFLAQGLFSARLLVQWIMSEKARRVVSPAIFWKLSIAASYLLFWYGWLRDDFAIIFGQLIAYYIYIWNLKIQGNWQRFNVVLRWILFFTPVVVILFMIGDWQYHFNRLFRNEDIPLWLMIYGSAGQVIFTLRFIYQWLYSKGEGESVLPLGFWIISLTGSLIIISYAAYRLDPVLLLGQLAGTVVYTRNIVIYHKSRKTGAEKKQPEKHS